MKRNNQVSNESQRLDDTQLWMAARRIVDCTNFLSQQSIAQHLSYARASFASTSHSESELSIHESQNSLHANTICCELPEFLLMPNRRSDDPCAFFTPVPRRAHDPCFYLGSREWSSDTGSACSSMCSAASTVASASFASADPMPSPHDSGPVPHFAAGFGAPRQQAPHDDVCAPRKRQRIGIAGSAAATSAPSPLEEFSLGSGNPHGVARMRR